MKNSADSPDFHYYIFSNIAYKVNKNASTLLAASPCQFERLSKYDTANVNFFNIDISLHFSSLPIFSFPFFVSDIFLAVRIDGLARPIEN